MNQKNSLGNNSAEGKITLSEVVSHNIASKFLTQLINTNEYYKQKAGLGLNDQILKLLLGEIQETQEWKQLFKQFEEKHGKRFMKIQVSLDSHRMQIQQDIVTVFDESIRILQQNREEYRREDQKIFQALKQGINNDKEIQSDKKIILPHLITRTGDMYQFFSEDLTINEQFNIIVDEFVSTYETIISPILIKKFNILLKIEDKHDLN